jgi:hypothetical protein
MNDNMVYDKSTLPTQDPKTAIRVNDGEFSYPSAAGSGHSEIELPALPGSPNPTERLLVRDFGVHVAAKIESSMTRQGYIKSGPQQSPAATFRHYVACAKGASLMDSGALKRMEQLAVEFQQEPEEREYFEMVLRPYLQSLTPKRR